MVKDFIPITEGAGQDILDALKCALGYLTTDTNENEEVAVDSSLAADDAEISDAGIQEEVETESTDEEGNVTTVTETKQKHSERQLLIESTGRKIANVLMELAGAVNNFKATTESNVKAIQDDYVTTDTEQTIIKAKTFTSTINGDSYGNAPKLGTKSVGSGTNPIYLSEGTVTASDSTIGSESVPIYLSGGVFTRSNTIPTITLNGQSSSSPSFYAATSTPSSSTVYLIASSKLSFSTSSSSVDKLSPGTGTMYTIPLSYGFNLLVIILSSDVSITQDQYVYAFTNSAYYGTIANCCAVWGSMTPSGLGSYSLVSGFISTYSSELKASNSGYYYDYEVSTSSSSKGNPTWYVDNNTLGEGSRLYAIQCTNSSWLT